MSQHGKSNVYMTKGLPGSGKSTWAKTKVGDGQTVIVSNDDLRVMFNNKLWQTNSKIRDKTEKFVAKAKNALIELALENHLDVIVDATHLSPKYETQLRELVGNRADIIIKDFTDVPLETCIENDLKRPNSVGSKVIMDMYERSLKKVQAPEREVIEFDHNLPNAIMVDVDGTLANIDWRDPYDASRCDEDGVYGEIVYLVNNMYLDGNVVIIMSGRMDTYQEPTKKWLANNQVRYDKLYMRQAGDYRKDSIIKKEIFDNHIRGKYNITFVLDDRNQVVDMWRSIGLRCLQVEEGNF